MREQSDERGRGDGLPASGDTAGGEPTIVIEDEALRRGFTQLPNYLFQVRGLSHSAKLTYALILSYAWQKDFCFPGQETLARDLEVSTRSVIEYLKELQAHKLIRIQRRGLGLTNVYHVLRYPPAPDDAMPPSHQELKKSSHQEMKRRAVQEVQRSSAPEMQQGAHQDLKPAASDKDASLTKTTKKTRGQQHAPAAARQEGVVYGVAPPGGAGPPSAPVDIGSQLQAHGIRGERLLAELSADPSEVLIQLQRLRDEMARGAVDNPAGWLVEAIRGRYRLLETDRPVLSTPPHGRTTPHQQAHDDGEATPTIPDDTPQGTAWQRVRAELRAELTSDNYRRWFVPTTAVAYTAGRLTIAVPDSFHRQWLDRRLRTAVERAAARVLGETVIEFVVDGGAGTERKTSAF